MAKFLLELYASRTDPAAVEASGSRARRAAEELTADGVPVRYLRWLFVPEDETCFHLYEADRADDVREAARRAGLPVERLVEAVAGIETPAPASASGQTQALTGVDQGT